MSDFDAVVVGAGPAGSTAARELALGGARVCFVDKAQFPRSKTCGGALSPRVLRRLPTGVDRLLRARIQRAVVTFRSGRPVEVTSDLPMGYMVHRKEFDLWLRNLAEEAGASIREGVAVRRIERIGSHFLIHAGRERIRAAAVIGADGANSVVRAQMFPHVSHAKFIGRVVEVPWNTESRRDTVVVDVGRYPGGYAWAFPKGDRLNVGVMMEFARAGESSGALEAFIRGLPGIAAGASASARIAPIAAPCGEPVACADGGVILVGDAARLADPFLGEGIYYAIRSGSLAAGALLAGSDGVDAAVRYEAAIAEAIWPELRAASRIASLFHRAPRWWHRVLSRMPGSLMEYVAVLAGEESYGGLLRDVRDRLGAVAGGWLLPRLGFSRDGAILNN